MESIDFLAAVIIPLIAILALLSIVQLIVVLTIERLSKMKAKIAAESMKSGIGTDTCNLLIPFIKKRREYHNYLEEFRRRREHGLRQLTLRQLRDLMESFREFLEGKSARQIADTLQMSKGEFENRLPHIREHVVSRLMARVELVHENIVSEIDRKYQRRSAALSLMCSLILVLALNVDFFAMYDSLSRHSVTGSIIVAKAETIDRQLSAINRQLENMESDQLLHLLPIFNEVQANQTLLQEQISSPKLKLGWTRGLLDRTFAALSPLLNKVLGLFVSALLISFSAPFLYAFLVKRAGIGKGLMEAQ